MCSIYGAWGVTTALAPYLEGGIAGWQERKLPTRRKRDATENKWVTREHPKIDRIGCPWLISRFVNPEAEFIYVPAAEVSKVAADVGGTPYDIKGVEFGLGFQGAARPGHLAHDPFSPGFTRPSNHAGGLEGGMTNGQPLVLRAAMKPIATIPKALPSVDLITGEAVQAHFERADVCAVPAAAVIVEAMVAWVLAAACLEKYGGDSVPELLAHYRVSRDLQDARLPRPEVEGAGGS